MSFRDEHDALRARLEAAESELKELRPLRARNRKLKREMKKLKKLVPELNSDNVDAMKKAHDQIALLESRTRDAHTDAGGGRKAILLWLLLCGAFTALYYLARH